MLRRLLLAGSGSSFVLPPNDYVGLINAAATSGYVYTIGPVSSSDGGLTWTAAGAATFSAGSGWDGSHVKDPSVFWDGSQFVMYYAGYNGSAYQIGRATAATITGSWTRDAGNPLLALGGGGSIDAGGLSFPTVRYDATASPPWQMWYTAINGSAVYTVAYADSTDGITWTKRGRVINVGAGGQFDDTGMHLGAVYLDGSTYYVYYGGWNSDGFRHSAYATCTDPASSGTYTKQGQLSGYGGLISLGGWDWRSNVPRCVVKRGSEYRFFIDFWNPGAASGPPTDTEEACAVTTATSLTSVPLPSGLAIPLGSGWYANSAENPSVIVAP
jgi:hypothetical protein